MNKLGKKCNKRRPNIQILGKFIEQKMLPPARKYANGIFSVPFSFFLSKVFPISGKRQKKGKWTEKCRK